MNPFTLPFSKKHYIIAAVIFIAGVIIFSVGIWLRLPPRQASAAGTDTWTDNSGDNNWNTPTNWSTGAVPNNAKTALFSASSTANCNINALVNVAGFSIAAGYTGTITQQTGWDITVGASGYSQATGIFAASPSFADVITDAATFSLAGGTFNAGPATITINGAFSQSGGSFVGSNGLIYAENTASFSLTGGTFTAPTGPLYILASSSTLSNSAFQNNSGTIYFDSSSTAVTITGSSTFYNLILGPHSQNFTSAITIATGTVLTSQGYLFIDTDLSTLQLLGGGAIDAQGNIEASYTPREATGTASIIVNGTGPQLIGDDVGEGAGYSQDTVMLPNVTFARTGTVNFAGNINILGNWTNTSGTTLNFGTSTVSIGPTFLFSDGTTEGNSISSVITGSSTFNNLVLGTHGNPLLLNGMFTIATGTVITSQGYFLQDSAYSATELLGGGTIDIQGNLEAGYNPYPAVTSTASVLVNGTGTQIIGDDTILANGYANDKVLVPNLTISKLSGVAYIEGPVISTGSSTVLQGELNLSTSSNASSFESDGMFTINSGALLSDGAVASSTLTLGTGLLNNGLIFLDGDGMSCLSNDANYVIINSTTTGQQTPWSGTGNFVLRYTSVQDQGGTAAISDWNGTSVSGNGANWTFLNGEPVPELIQTSTASGGAGTSQIALPAFGFRPRTGDLIVVAVSARNQTITAPTDNVNNTYALIASSTFGSSPSYALNLYYAKNITTTSSFIVTLNGTGGGGAMLSGSAFEYTGLDASSSFDTYSANTDTSGSATTLTSFGATGRSANELFFGSMTMAASTTATSGSGWTPEVGTTNNNTTQTLYNEDFASSTLPTIAATWTSATATAYTAVLGLFHSPYTFSYVSNGTLDSATFDTGVATGAELNSFSWQGATPSNSKVKFQFAVSNSSAGPWNFEGPDGTASTYFSGTPAASVGLIGTTNGYTLFNGYRYFRYRVTLFTDSAAAYTPTVSQVVVNWSQ